VNRRRIGQPDDQVSDPVHRVDLDDRAFNLKAVHLAAVLVSDLVLLHGEPYSKIVSKIAIDDFIEFFVSESLEIRENPTFGVNFTNP
jgi:hypothetical protein